MELRMIFYGYIKEQFSYIIDDAESEIVQEIFNRYISGETLIQIANDLTKRHIVYYKEKTTWSKQFIRRIIENEHYCGDDNYPAIIGKEIFDKANSIKLSKGGERQRDSDEIAWLKAHSFCKQCGNKFSRKSAGKSGKGKWGYSCGCKYNVKIDDSFYLCKIESVINKVILNPSLLRNNNEVSPFEPSFEIIREEKEILRLLEQSKPQFKTIKSAIYHNISKKYQELTLDTSGIVSDLLIEYFSKLNTAKGLDLGLLKNTVSKIEVRKSGEISVLFINNATVESEESDNDTNNKSSVTKDSDEN